jgi:hypothetical protein
VASLSVSQRIFLSNTAPKKKSRARTAPPEKSTTANCVGVWRLNGRAKLATRPSRKKRMTWIEDFILVGL